MQFEKDIFISYAHIDDEALSEHQRGWISDFHRALDIRLAQLMGRKPQIWRDARLQGNDLFAREITGQFSNVAVMISILSPRYVRSEWCLREINEFHQVCQQNGGYTLDNRVRIFKVVKTPIPRDMHPQQVRDILGYEFYSTDTGNGRIREYAQAFGQQIEALYWEKLNDLVHDIALFLQQLDKAPKPLTLLTPAPAPAISGPDQEKQGIFSKDRAGRKIFLAESSFDIQPFRDNIKRELQDNGYQVYPDRQLPLLTPTLVEEVKTIMQETDIAIHLVGENYGIVPEGTSRSMIELQNEIGATCSAARRMPRLIWIPEGNEPADERQLSFIDKLNKGREETTGADLIISSLEDFKTIASDKLRAIEEKEKKKALEQTPAGHSAKMVYLICDLLDAEAIMPLEDFLFANGFEVVTPIFDGDESQIREDHIENLKTCTAAIIFFGYASELWLRSKMRDFLKINGYGRPGPLLAKAVYLAGPASAAKQRFRTLEAEVINAMGSLPEEQLKTLLSKQ